MLTQEGGPLYRRLFLSGAVSNAESERLSTDCIESFDLIVVRFDDEATELKCAGLDFFQCPPEERMRRIQQNGANEGIELHDGPIGWPFAPFYELTKRIETMVPGRWIRHHEDGRAIYYLYLRAVETIAQQAETTATRRMLAQRIQHERLVRQHRLKTLVTAAFSFDSTAAKPILAYWRSHPDADSLLSKLPASLGGTTLFRYREAEQEIAVSAATFCRSFNDLLVRKVPRLLTELRRSAEDFVLQEFDLRQARDLGLDREPQFIEDRHGYTGFLVFDLFEREELRPAAAGGGPPTQNDRDLKVLRFASSLAGRIEVEDHLDYGRYGANPAAVRLFWH